MRPAEHVVAGDLVVRAYRALPGAHLSGGYADELADVARRAQEAEVLVALAPASGDVVGCVTFVPDATSPWAELLDEGDAGIRMLAVDPATQGHGIGRALVEACIERARRLGRHALLLHTTPWMTAAHRLYEQAGFTRFAARDWTPEPGVPLLAYRLTFPGGEPHEGGGVGDQGTAGDRGGDGDQGTAGDRGGDGDQGTTGH